MSCLSEELELPFNRYVVQIREVNDLDTLDHLLNVLFNGSLRPHMALVIQLWVTYIADVLPQILPDTVGKRLHVAVIAQLLHHESAGLKPVPIVPV